LRPPSIGPAEQPAGAGPFATAFKAMFGGME
jgi:hypothetical protein